MLSLLAPMTNTATFGDTAGFAADLAGRLGAALTGLCATPVVVPMPVMDAPLFLNDIIDDLIADRDRAIAREAAFLQWAHARGVAAADWQVVEGPLDEALAGAGLWHDAVVLGCAAAAKDSWQHPDAVGCLLVNLRQPCIVVPPGATTRLHCVAIAWNGSREALRAVHAAQPLLRHAHRVVVLRPAEVGGEEGIWHPPFELERYLDRHGIAAGRLLLRDPQAGSGETLLQTAAAVGADLLVMGAYGRRRFSEWVFGGATRHALQHARIPLFMTH
jgi:nucleotide-binding universal stress UspA family protein